MDKLHTTSEVLLVSVFRLEKLFLQVKINIFYSNWRRRDPPVRLQDEGSSRPVLAMRGWNLFHRFLIHLSTS
jgi:hypothetical protein